MNRSLLVPVAALSLLAPVASGAPACVPSPYNSTKPSLIRLVGASGGGPDAAAGQFEVVVRDLAMNQLNGASVVIDFSGCSDLSICSDQMDPNAVVNCVAKTVRKFTNAQGQATFTILGSSNGTGNAATLLAGARIFGNGTCLGNATAASFDLDGNGVVGAGDLSVWLGDFGSGVPYGRSDFDGSGSIGACDLSEWLGVFGAGGSTRSCAASCP